MSKHPNRNKLAQKPGSQEVGKPEPRSMTFEAQAFSGPLPPPAVMEAYERICPGAAERIMSLAEREQGHRHQTEDRLVEAKVADRHLQRREFRLGQIFGFVIGMTGLTASVYLSTHGAPGVGGTIGTTVVVSLVTAFLYGSREQRRSRQANAQKNEGSRK